MSEAANKGFRSRAAESGARCFVPAEDQAGLGPASPGTLPFPEPTLLLIHYIVGDQMAGNVSLNR